jgi:hypothetical protein
MQISSDRNIFYLAIFINYLTKILNVIAFGKFKE